MRPKSRTFLTTSEIAEITGLSPKASRARALAGQFGAHVIIGRRVLVRKSSFERAMGVRITVGPDGSLRVEPTEEPSM
jgi:hypothetical protein